MTLQLYIFNALAFEWPVPARSGSFTEDSCEQRKQIIDAMIAEVSRYPEINTLLKDPHFFCVHAVARIQPADIDNRTQAIFERQVLSIHRRKNIA